MTGEGSGVTPHKRPLAFAAQRSGSVAGEGSGPASGSCDRPRFVCVLALVFAVCLVALVNSEACGSFKGKSMTRKVEAWREEAQEGPGRGSMDRAVCRPLRREGRVTARAESKAGTRGRWEWQGLCTASYRGQRPSGSGVPVRCVVVSAERGRGSRALPRGGAVAAHCVLASGSAIAGSPHHRAPVASGGETWGWLARGLGR